MTDRRNFDALMQQHNALCANAVDCKTVECRQVHKDLDAAHTYKGSAPEDVDGRKTTASHDARVYSSGDGS